MVNRRVEQNKGPMAQSFLWSGTVRGMIDLLRDLIRHKGHANAALLRAISQHQAASHDEELRQLLHHIILANRFWLMLTLGESLDLEKESPVPGSLEAIASHYRDTYRREVDWMFHAGDQDLNRRLETPFLQVSSFSVAEAAMQVCLHSHGHRAQIATKLRLLGGQPPNMDFILWLKNRPEPDWI